MTPFRPADDATSSVAATTTPGVNRAALKRQGAENPHVRLCNAGSVLVFVRFGDGAVSASATDMPLPPGAVEVIEASGTHFDVVASSGTARVYATCGRGL